MPRAGTVSSRLAGVPVLYLPLAVLPVMSSRQSGFLIPTYGHHQAGGSVVEAPFFWAINNYSDLTLYQTVFSNRGYMQGGEYRRRGHDEAAANFRFFYMNDSFSQNTTNRRYWASGMINQPLGDWEARGTLDKVSDSSFLADFNFGYMGLNRYSRELLMEFGRDLEQEEVNTRVSSFLLARNFSMANLTLYTRFYEKLVNNDPNLFNRLPGAALNSIPVPLGGLPLYLGLSSSYNYFYQNHGMTGDRLDFHPNLTSARPTAAGHIVQLPGGVQGDPVSGGPRRLRRPSGAIYPPAIVRYQSEPCPGPGRRITAAGRNPPDFFRHILRPEVSYTNLPRFNPQRYPQFDPLDQGWVARVNRNLPVREGDEPVGGVNALTYGIANNILWRSQNDQGQNYGAGCAVVPPQPERLF